MSSVDNVHIHPLVATHVVCTVSTFYPNFYLNYSMRLNITLFENEKDQ